MPPFSESTQRSGSAKVMATGHQTCVGEPGIVVGDITRSLDVSGSADAPRGELSGSRDLADCVEPMVSCPPGVQRQHFGHVIAQPPDEHVARSMMSPIKASKM